MFGECYGVFLLYVFSVIIGLTRLGEVLVVCLIERVGFINIA